MAEEIIKETKETKIKEEPKIHPRHPRKMMLVGGLFFIFLAVGILAAGIVTRHTLGERNRAFNGPKQGIRGEVGARNGSRQMMGGAGMMYRNGGVAGKVTAVDGKTFTIDASGTSVKVQIVDATRFPISSATTVAVNDQVVVSGEKDSSGTVQATRILVNPTLNK
jgi:hypothetical protein